MAGIRNSFQRQKHELPAVDEIQVKFTYKDCRSAGEAGADAKDHRFRSEVLGPADGLEKS
jgi:hypothetical protein